MSNGGDAGECPLEVAGQQADDNHQNGSDKNGQTVMVAVEIIVAQGAGNGGQGIDVLVCGSI